nr:hypothetical protein [Tanacetum cinerariifolium]
MDLWCVKACWGNYAFDFVHSDSVGNSEGILCIWDPNSFRKNNVTVPDYFCMVWGVWLKTGVDILMMVVYAPQELRDKQEVPLGGSSFTWCHKSATKMSKLDTFLISKNLMISCPNIIVISLDRYLSDH